MNRIVIELHPEDRSRLDAITEALGKMQQDCARLSDVLPRLVEWLRDSASEPAPVESQTPAEDPAPTPAEEQPPFEADTPAPTPNPAPTPDPAPAVEPPSLAEFQKAVALCCVENPAIKPKVRELVSRYAASVSGIPTEKRIEFLELLTALKGV